MRRSSDAVVAALAFAVAGAFATYGCSGTTCEDSGTCTAPLVDDAGADAGETVYPEVPPPPGCDVNADAKSAPECVVDGYALFVDGLNGSNANAGTKAAPLRTITAATVNDTRRGRPRIYVCGEGPYVESVKLPAGVSLFGGAECGTWRFAEAPPKTRIAPEAPGYALHVDGSAKGVAFSDLALVAADATEPGASSIGVFIHASKAVFRRIDGKAGSGKAASIAEGTNNHAEALSGNAAVGSAGGGAKTCKCPLYGESSAGKGGDVGEAGGAGTATPSGTPSSFNDGAGADLSCSGIGAHPGTHGASRSAGAGAAVVGQLTPSGWIAGAGADGEAGNPGGGGGGGSGATTAASGGGCGGCGGGGGKGGKGGGSSIVMAILASDVKLEACSLVAGAATNGGGGGPGQAGQAGGASGGGASCAGAVGGNGAGGGGGGGGAGGVSKGVVRAGGSFAKDDATTITVGGPGFGGPAGDAGPKVQTSAGTSEAGKYGTLGASFGDGEPVLELGF